MHKNYLLIIFTFIFIGAAPLLMGAHFNINGINTETLASSQSIANGATFTSAASTLMGRCENISVQYRVATGTGKDVTFGTTTSLDETNYATPETGAVIEANVTDANWHHAIVQVPVSKGIKITALNNSANSCTVDIIIGGQ